MEREGNGEMNRSSPSGIKGSLSANSFRPQHPGSPEELWSSKEAISFQAAVTLSRSLLERRMSDTLVLDPGVTSRTLIWMLLGSRFLQTKGPWL